MKNTMFQMLRYLLTVAICLSVLASSTISLATGNESAPYVVSFPEESEPNNILLAANVISLNNIMTGYISESGDVDFFALNSPNEPNVTVTISLQVSNAVEKNYYYLTVFDSNETVLAQTTSSVKTVTLLASDGPFIIKVYRSGTGYSTTTQYTISTSSVAAMTVPLYTQSENNTCGAASVRMILASYGLYYGEDAIVAKANELSGNQGTYVYAQALVLNYYLSARGMTTRYQYADMTNSTVDTYDSRLWNNVANGYPVLVVLKISDTTYFPYTSSGHYMVVTSLNRSSSQNNVTVNDPHYNYSDEYVLPVSVLKTYGDNHSGYVVYVNN